MDLSLRSRGTHRCSVRCGGARGKTHRDPNQVHQNPVNWQPLGNLPIRKRSEKPRRTRITQETGPFDDLDKQVESGQGRKSQDVVRIT